MATVQDMALLQLLLTLHKPPNHAATPMGLHMAVRWIDESSYQRRQSPQTEHSWGWGRKLVLVLLDPTWVLFLPPEPQ